MKPKLDPFTTMMDLRTGALDPERDLAPRRVRDMTGYFLHGDDADLDQLVYEVSAMPVEPSNSELQSSTTVIQPGRVGDEYHMTKGHFHIVRDRSEIYVGLRGEGRLVMATEDGQHWIEPMLPGAINYVPGGWAHRSVNVGDDELVFLAVYVGDAGQDYRTIEERGFPVRVVVGDDGQPEVVDNPRYRR